MDWSEHASNGYAAAGVASRSLLWHSTFDNAQSRHDAIVRGHAFNQQLQVVLPTASAVSVAESLRWESSMFYQVTAPITTLLRVKFVDEYVVNGRLYMMAKNAAIDCQNTAMVLPSGHLLLLVDQSTYERLGLIGTAYPTTKSTSVHQSKRTGASSERLRGRTQRLDASFCAARRFLVAVDLRSESFAAEAADGVRDRVVQCLEQAFEPLEMLLAASTLTGASKTIRFDDDDSLQRTRVELNGQVEHLEEVAVPLLQTILQECGRDARQPMEELRTALGEAYDWLGLVACRCSEVLRQQAIDPYVSTFVGVPETIPLEATSQVACVNWRGLITAEFVKQILIKVRAAVQQAQVPWAALMVWGFPDAIVSWEQEQEHKKGKHSSSSQQRRKTGTSKTNDQSQETTTDDSKAAPNAIQREHGFLLNGSNHYTFIVLPNNEYYVLQELGPHDATK